MRLQSIEGYNADVDTGTEDVYAAGGDVNFPAAAAATTVVSASTDDDGSPVGTGARTVRITGLNSSFKQIVEDATLNGTGAVTLTNEFLRVLKIEVLTVGSGGVSAGAISVKHSSTVIGYLEAGINVSRTAAWMADKNYANHQITGMYGAITNAVSNIMTLALQVRPYGGAWLTKHTMVLHGVYKPSDHWTFDAPVTLAQSDDVRIRATAGADNMGIVAGFDTKSSSSPL